MKQTVSAKDAWKRLKTGNEAYLASSCNNSDISPALREKTAKEGQYPYAVIVACSDSRVIPEDIFMAGIGELFVIRVAGNVIDNHQLGSIEYAASHLGCRLIVVLGHTHCGAIDAAIHHDPEGYIKYLTDEISLAIGSETDALKACWKNVERSVSRIKDSLDIQKEDDVCVLGAVCDIETGRVDWEEKDLWRRKEDA